MPAVLTIGSRQVMPWKNGGGSTTELYVSPAGAALDAFDWRLSLATIASPGPFSSFPGIDRSLALVAGAGVTLEINAGDDARQVRLDGSENAYCVQFAGEAQVAAHLISGPTTDFNVMTRRSRCRHTLQRLLPTENSRFTHCSGHSLLFVCAAPHGASLHCRAVASGREYQLTLHDSLLLAAKDEADWQLRADAGVIVYAVQIIAL